MTGVLRILTDDQMVMLRDAAIDLLVNAGMKIKNDEILGLLEKEGASIDRTTQRAFLTSSLISRLIPDNPSTMSEWELNPPDADNLNVWGSHPFVMDWPGCQKREASRADLTEILKAVHTLEEISAIGPPVSICELPAVIEPVESLALTMQITDKKIAPAEIQLPEQIKYAVRLSEIYTGQPNSTALVSGGDYFQSPLVFGARSAECILEKARFGLPSFIGTMATSGLNSPGTVAGTITQALAELLGGLVIGKAINPELDWGSIACTGILDMSTGSACFSSPECTLQDMSLYQIMRRIYGRQIIVAEHYIDAPTPGIQATFEKTYRFNAAASFGAHILLNNGILDAGLAFSGVQCCLDLDTNRSLLQMYRGIEVNEETIGRDVILEACLSDSPNFLDMDHTVTHCRDNFWYPKLPLRAKTEAGIGWYEHSARILEIADERWKNAIATYEPINLSDDKRQAIEQVLVDARKELL